MEANTQFEIKCACGCDHVKNLGIADGIWSIERSACRCPSWVDHVICYADTEITWCQGGVYGEGDCPRPPEPGKSFCRGHRLAIELGIDPVRLWANPADEGSAEPQARALVATLVDANARAEEVAAALLAFHAPAENFTPLRFARGEVKCFFATLAALKAEK